MEFEKVQNTYRDNAFVQKQMAEKLISILTKTKGYNFNTILEIGAGTGFLTDKITERLKYNKIILNDITENFTKCIPDIYIKGDILKTNIPFDKIDLIMSNACFQWINDYYLLFSKLYDVMSNDSILCFTYFGNKNFHQIKEITGIGLSYPDLDNIIKEHGFEIVYFEEELETMYFESVKDLLKHIRLTGVKTDNKTWTKNDFKLFEQKYYRKFKDSMGYELTYHPVYYLLKKG